MDDQRTVEEDSCGRPADNGLSEPLPSPVLGDAKAPVTVAVFGDFACAGCRAFHENVVPHLRREYADPGIIGYEHHDYPRPGRDDPEIRRASNAARAAQDVCGDGAFYEFAAGLFENQPRLGDALYGELATDVGAEPDAVVRAAETRRYEATVEADRERGAERGVSAVPAVFIDDEEFTGTTLDGLTDLVEEKRG